jgi:hypothetical protein
MLKCRCRINFEQVQSATLSVGQAIKEAVRQATADESAGFSIVV